MGTEICWCFDGTLEQSVLWAVKEAADLLLELYLLRACRQYVNELYLIALTLLALKPNDDDMVMLSVEGFL